MNDSPVLLMAPFRGISHKAYRNALARHIGGLDAFYAPFVSGTGTQRIHPSKLSDLLPVNDHEAPVIPQIISSDAREIALFAQTMADHGFDHINWNLGCPFRRIAFKGRGCGMLPHPENIDQILEKLFAELPVKLSVKTRLGYFSKSEIRQLMPVFNRYPLHSIILHPRTGLQLYGGRADTASFGECLAMTNHNVVYNGDLIHRSGFQALNEGFGTRVTAWMPGRGILMNPFLALEIRGTEPDNHEKKIRLRAFHDALYAHFSQWVAGEARQLGAMKALWHYMAGCLHDGLVHRKAISRAGKHADYQRAADLAMQADFATEQEREKYFFRQ